MEHMLEVQGAQSSGAACIRRVCHHTASSQRCAFAVFRNAFGVVVLSALPTQQSCNQFVHRKRTMAGNIPVLQAAVERVWPSTSQDPRIKVRNYVAKYLLQQQGYLSFLSTAGASFAANRGSVHMPSTISQEAIMLIWCNASGKSASAHT